MKLNLFTIDLFNPLVELEVMAQLKKHAILIASIFAMFCGAGLVVYKCEHRTTISAPKPASGPAAPGGTQPTDPTTPTTPTTTTNILTDPTTLGAIITSILGAIGVAWKALQSRNPQAIIQAVEGGVKEIGTIRDVVKGGTTLTPSDAMLAKSIAVLMGNPDQPTELQLALAKDLNAKYTITVKI